MTRLALLALIPALALADAPEEAPVRPLMRYVAPVPKPEAAILPPERTVSILSGEALRYAVTAGQGGVTLDLSVAVPAEAYETLPMFRDCAKGCRLRVYIVQEGER